MWKEIWILGYRVVCKVYEVGSHYGLKDAPRISRLSIYKKGKEMYNYDRGLDFDDMPPFVLKQIIKICDWIF